MISCTRILEWDMGHRVYGHESKCSHPHGHRYKAEITAVSAGGLDEKGRIIDFSVLKGKVGAWIDENWDHSFMLRQDDPAAPVMSSFPDTQGTPRINLVPFNPTAEEMAAYLGNVICPFVLKDTNVQVVAVRIFETPNCYADWNILPTAASMATRQVFSARAVPAPITRIQKPESAEVQPDPSQETPSQT